MEGGKPQLLLFELIIVTTRENCGQGDPKWWLENRKKLNITVF